MKTYYIQLDQNNIIRDVVEIPVEGYIPVQIEGPLPVGINGGWWRFKNGQPVEYPELKPETELEQRIADLEAAIAAILGGAV